MNESTIQPKGYPDTSHIAEMVKRCESLGYSGPYEILVTESALEIIESNIVTQVNEIPLRANILKISVI